jgi:IS5 family transposase
MRESTIIDATLIAAPPSTKKHDKQRDPQMHQAVKGNARHFRKKAFLSVDASSGLVHTLIGMARHVADIAKVHALLHGAEKMVPADARYPGIEKWEENITKPSIGTWH